MHVSTLRLTIAAAFSLCAGLRAAESPLRPLPPDTVIIGEGGGDGFVAIGPDGAIHVIVGGKYRHGSAPVSLGPGEAIAADLPVHGVRLVVDSKGKPHVVFTAGATDKATRSYYTARVDGRWLPPEKFADAADFPERGRAYVADVAVDENANVLTSFWVSRPTAQRSQYDNPSFHYRWRTPAGEWTPPRSLPAHWSSAPKVDFEPGRGFYLLWQFRNVEWRIAGPVAAGATFEVARSIASGSEKLTGMSTVQNEGAEFIRGHGGAMLVAGNVRENFDGPVGVWAALLRDDQPAPATYLGGFPGTKRGSESGLHPVLTFDAATGAAFVAVMDPASKRACYIMHQPGTGWQPGYTPLLPDHPVPQGTLRQGPSIADVPGPGVIALVRDGAQRWYLRTLRPAAATRTSPKK